MYVCVAFFLTRLFVKKVNMIEVANVFLFEKYVKFVNSTKFSAFLIELCRSSNELLIKYLAI